MTDEISDGAPTSTATTPETEPEVVAGIMSGEGQPYVPASHPRHRATGNWPLILGGGVMLGLLAARLVRPRR